MVEEEKMKRTQPNNRWTRAAIARVSQLAWCAGGCLIRAASTQTFGVEKK
jgi:hypothetical protein